MDGQILLWIQEHLRSDMATPVMEFITHLGDTAFIWIGMAAVFFVLRKTRRTGVETATALLFSLLANNVILKNLVARVRPYEVVEGLTLLIEKQPDWSFPSGHAASSFAAATVIWLNHRRCGWLALVLAALIAFSRLYVGVHYPSDVVFGALDGILLGVAACRCWRWIRSKRAAGDRKES